MIRRLVHACLRARFVVVAAAIALLVAGAVAGRGAPLDAFPEFSPPFVAVQAEAPGLSSLDVENLVTTPMENVLSGTPFVTTVRSTSVLGLSSVTLLFEPGTDLFVARQLVQERLARAAALLPASARAPVMLAPASSTGRVLMIGLTSETLSQVEITELVRWTLRPQLLAVPGVGSVSVWGARQREYDVRLDPGRLDAAGVGSDEVLAAVRAAATPIAGGYVDGPTQRMPLRHTSPIGSAADLEDLPVASRGGAVVRVRDVATVADTHPPPIGDAVVDDRPGLLLVVEKQPWGNTLEITRRVDEVLAQVKPALPGVEIDASIFRPASFVERSVGNLEEAMLVGVALVVAVLALFLWSWRTALISAVAIPLSIAAAVLVLRALGGTLNTMILAGLVIALGEVVDDAIIDVENIARRLRDNRALPAPRPVAEVVLAASLEVRSAVVYATVIVVLVFLPVWFLEGVSGAFFRPLALAYGLGVLASMVVALTVTPALSMLLLPRSPGGVRHAPLAAWLARRYEALLPRILPHPRAVIGAGGAAVALGALGFALLGDAFLPVFRENDFLTHWIAQPGTSLPALGRTTLRVSRELRAIPGITSFGSHLGRAEAADEIVGPNFGELWIHVGGGQDHDAVERRITETIEKYPGLRHDLETYLRECVEEVVSGARGAIVVRLFGPDLAALRAGADDLAARLRGVAGVAAVQVEQQTAVPEVRVTPRREAAALGFLPGDVRRAVDVLVRGAQAGELVQDGRPIAVVVRGEERLREDVSALREVPIVSPTGARARLADVADVTIAPTPNVVPHEGASRRIDVSLEVDGDLGAVARAVEAVVEGTRLPPAHHAEVLGEWKEREDARRRLLGFAAVSLALILGVLYSDLATARRTAVVAASLPFALAGGVAGAWLSGGVLSLGSLVGLVTVLGIASRNGILLVSHYRHLEEEGVAFGPALVVRGSVERVGPILMTALATGLALVPLVLAGDAPGHEIEHPMAVVILGGLVSSTALNLLVLPTLYLRFGASRPRAG